MIAIRSLLPTNAFNLDLAPTINFSQSLPNRSPKSRTPLTRTNTSLSTTWDNISFGNSSSAGESSISILPPTTSSLGLGLPPIPGISALRKNPRRVMSEVPTFGGEAQEEVDESYRFKHSDHRRNSKEKRRRHSFNIVADAPEPLIIVSRLVSLFS